MKRLYIIYSYFNFFHALLLAYKNRAFEDAIFILVKRDGDNSNFQGLIEKLDFKFIEIVVLPLGENKSLDRVLLSKSLYTYIKKNQSFISRDKIYLSQEDNFYVRFVVSLLLSHQQEVLADGASIIWDEPAELKGVKNYFYMLCNKLFRTPTIFELANSIDRDVFIKEWSFYKKYYCNLPIDKDKLWIIGTSIAFVKPYDLSYYSPLSRKFFERGGWKKEHYIFWINDLVKSAKKLKTKNCYFPHPIESSDLFDKNVNFTYKSYPIEFIPIEKNYIPKYIVCNSTSAFSFLNIKKSCNLDIEIYVFHQTEEIDNVYKKYGANILYPDNLNIEELL